jgi:hypothetical protein
MSTRSRVFVSGGLSGRSEISTIRSVASTLQDLGFDPYVATEQQTLADLNSNVLRSLEESEYIVFVDFARRVGPVGENPVDPTQRRFPRSLYSHQELAVATYLRLELLAFRERPPRREQEDLQGFLRFQQANCIPFSGRGKLPGLVRREVRKRLRNGEWRKGWRRGVTLKPANPPTSEALDGQFGGASTRYFHLKVANGDWRRTVWNCAIHVSQIETQGPSTAVEPTPVELKFHGVNQSTVIVPAGGSRQFAVLRMPYDSAVLRGFAKPPFAKSYALLAVNPFLVDFPGLYSEYLLQGPSDHLITLRIVTDLFVETYRHLLIRLGTDPTTTSVRVLGY